VGEDRGAHRRGLHALRAQPRDEHQVALRLRHLLPVETDHAGVQEVLGHGPAGQGRAVPGAHLVVREDEVGAPALHGEGRGQVLQRDQGALDVPPRPAGPEGRPVPRGLARALDAPQQGVQRVPLAGALRVPAALGEDRQHLLRGEVGDVPEHPRGVVVQGAGGLDVEVDVAVGLPVRSGHAVGEAAAEQLLDGGDDPADGLGGAHVVLGREDVEGAHVRAEQLGLLGGQLAPVHARGLGPLEQGVVHVGDVLDVVHGRAGVEPGAVQHVEGHVGGGVAHVGGVVRGDPADVEARALLPGQLRATPQPGVLHHRQGGLAGEVGDGSGGPGFHAHLGRVREREDRGAGPPLTYRPPRGVPVRAPGGGPDGAPGGGFGGGCGGACGGGCGGQALIRPSPRSTKIARPSAIRYQTKTV
jgi:hypothetical protein